MHSHSSNIFPRIPKKNKLIQLFKSPTRKHFLLKQILYPIKKMTSKIFQMKMKFVSPHINKFQKKFRKNLIKNNLKENSNIYKIIIKNLCKFYLIIKGESILIK